MVTSDLGNCEWFVYELRRSNLIDRGQLEQVVGEFLKKFPRAEPPALAEYLVTQKILSQFQAERVLQGKTQGLVLGPYNLIDAIGSGSMGQVFKALSKTDNKWYAVKVLPRRSMWNVRLARRQVRAFGQFSHTAVVPFMDVGTSGGLHYLVWPLIEGETLEAIVQRQGKLPPGQAASIGLSIADGLNVCHQNGLFHGLLKPSNVMVGPDGVGRLLDFGIGSLLVENDGESLVDTMSTANTLTSGLDCASPESIMEPTNRTPAGDQYSLGCVLYFCLTGRVPFPEGTAVEKMMAHQFKQPDALREVAPEVPAELAAVVERLMQKAPEARYGGADEVVEALQPFASAAQPARPRPTAPSRLAEPAAAPQAPRRAATVSQPTPTPAESSRPMQTRSAPPVTVPTRAATPAQAPTNLPQVPTRRTLTNAPPAPVAAPPMAQFAPLGQTETPSKPKISPLVMAGGGILVGVCLAMIAMKFLMAP